MSIFKRLFSSSPATKERILNVGLNMAMEFGSNWLQPINDRLKKRFGNLNELELQDYDKVCRQAMDEGNEYIYNTLITLANKGETITNRKLKELFKLNMKSKFNWISNWSLRKLYSQGRYYAWKNGLDKTVSG